MSDAPAMPKRAWTDYALMALLIGTSAWASLTLSRGPGELAAVWIGNGILVGWLLSRATAQWPGYVALAFAVEFAARLATAETIAQAAPISATNVVEVLMVAGGVRRFVPNVGDPKRWISLGGIATSTTLIACVTSGLIAASIIATLHSTSFVVDFITWFAAHVVGMVIFATSTLVVHREGKGLIAAPGRRWSFVLTMLLLAVVSLAIFLSRYPILFMAYPVLLLGAFRHRFAGVAVGVILLTLIGSAATALGHGPLWLVDGFGTAGRVALLQLYIAGGCLMTIPVALAMAERKRLVAGLRESEHRYRLLADYSHDVIVRMRVDGERIYVSPSAQDILGWTPAEMLGTRTSLIHPDDLQRQTQIIAEVIASHEPVTSTYRVRHKEGHYVWIEAVTRTIPSTAGEGFDLIYAGRDVTRRVIAEQALEANRLELRRLALVDTLTGLANRRQFDERLALALARLQRHGTPTSLMFLDIDHFKRINDTYGHAAGDEILRVFAHRLLNCVRNSDLAARLGGDEFVVLIEDAAVPEAAEAVARKLIATMNQDVVIDGTTIRVTTSIGIAYTHVATDAATFMSVADAALYHAKRERNTFHIESVTAPPPGNVEGGFA